MENNLKTLVDSGTLMQYLQISEATLVRLKKRRIIPYVKVGGSHRYDLEKIIRILEVSEKK